VARGVVEFHRFIEAQLVSRQSAPRDDLMSDFVLLNRESAQPLELAELVEQVHGLVTAGHESTANLLTLTLYHLLEVPSRWARVCASPDSIPQMLEEALRFDGPVLGVWRRVAQDIVVADKKIAEGERVYCVLGSAGRDEDAFDNPNEFVVDRVQPRQHMAFGRGMHTCVGASLARLEGRVAFEVLGRRIPSARLAQGSLACVANATLRIPAGLLIEWDV
jgi:cytochrome P450